MTEQEAIKNLEDENEKCLRLCEGACSSIVNYQCTCRDAVMERMLEELLQYRKIGTVEECREAVKKQKEEYLNIESFAPAYCPKCGCKLCIPIGNGLYSYLTFLKKCPKCRSAIRWDT